MSALALPALDHVVLLVRDLDRAADEMRSAGFTVLRRADTKEKPGSTFRFVSFPDGSYLLLNAFSEDALSRHRLGPVLREREGWGDWSVCVADLDAAVDRAAAAGIPVGPENSVTNFLSTGEPWSLRLLVSGRGSKGDPALPFLVQDTQGRSARIPGPSVHANGATGIAGVTLAADDPAATAARLAALLDLPAPSGPHLRIGDMEVGVVATDPAASGTARLGGPVAVSFRGLAQEIAIGRLAVAGAGQPR